MPCLKYLHASIAGIKMSYKALNLAAKMGYKKGQLDVCLPVRNGYHCALHIEMKAGKNKLTKEQKEWCAFLLSQGRSVHAAYSADEAINIIEEYLL